MLAILLISDISVKPQALFYYCTYRNFTVFGLKYKFKSSKCLQYYCGVACATNYPNQMWGCQVLKALVILLWNHKHCSITVSPGTLRFSAQNTICDDILLQSYRYANASICTVWYHEENMNECPNNDEWMSYDQWPLLNDPRLTMSNDPESIRVCEDFAHSMQSWKYQWPIYAVIGTNDHSMQSWLPMTIQFGLGFHSSSLQKFYSITSQYFLLDFC